MIPDRIKYFFTAGEPRKKIGELAKLLIEKSNSPLGPYQWIDHIWSNGDEAIVLKTHEHMRVQAVKRPRGKYGIYRMNTGDSEWSTMYFNNSEAKLIFKAFEQHAKRHYGQLRIEKKAKVLAKNEELMIKGLFDGED